MVKALPALARRWNRDSGFGELIARETPRGKRRRVRDAPGPGHGPGLIDSTRPLARLTRL